MGFPIRTNAPENPLWEFAHRGEAQILESPVPSPPRPVAPGPLPFGVLGLDFTVKALGLDPVANDDIYLAVSSGLSTILDQLGLQDVPPISGEAEDVGHNQEGIGRRHASRPGRDDGGNIL